MSHPRKEKMAKVFSVEEAATYLRQIADALEQGHIKFDETELDIEGAVQFKSALKSKSQKTTLKMKLRFAPMEEAVEAGEEASPAAPGQPESPKDLSYKKLKKQMAADFKQIKTHIKNEETPPMGLLEAFFQDCLAMIGFPDKGDEYYPPFEAAAKQMLEAGQKADRAQLSRVVETLDQLKKDCHDRYK